MLKKKSVIPRDALNRSFVISTVHNVILPWVSTCDEMLHCVLKDDLVTHDSFWIIFHFRLSKYSDVGFCISNFENRAFGIVEIVGLKRINNLFHRGCFAADR